MRHDPNPFNREEIVQISDGRLTLTGRGLKSDLVVEVQGVFDQPKIQECIALPPPQDWEDGSIRFWVAPNGRAEAFTLVDYDVAVDTWPGCLRREVLVLQFPIGDREDMNYGVEYLVMP